MFQHSRIHSAFSFLELTYAHVIVSSPRRLNMVIQHPPLAPQNHIFYRYQVPISAKNLHGTQQKAEPSLVKPDCRLLAQASCFCSTVSAWTAGGSGCLCCCVARSSRSPWCGRPTCQKRRCTGVLGGRGPSPWQSQRPLGEKLTRS